MIPHPFYLFFLIVHLTAFAIFTGTFFANIITSNQLWLYAKKDTAIMRAILITYNKYARIMGICLGLTVITGILMMVNMHKVYGGQLWLRVKIILLLIILVFRILSTRSFRQFKNRLANEAMVSFDDIKKRLTLFQVVQLVLLTGIIVLAVCRFN